MVLTVTSLADIVIWGCGKVASNNLTQYWPCYQRSVPCAPVVSNGNTVRSDMILSWHCGLTQLFRVLTVSIIGLDIWSSVCVSLNVIQWLALLVSQFQAITWGILSLLGILTYTGDIKVQTPVTASNQFQWVLVQMYFFPNSKYMA